MRHLIRAGIAASLAAFAAGCATSQGIVVRPWPSLVAPAPKPGAPTAQAPAAPISGILFKLNVDADMQGMFISQFDMSFSQIQEIQKDVPMEQRQRLILEGNALNKFPNDVVLLPLRPGEYYGVNAGVLYNGVGTNQFIRASSANDAFEHFNVPPGKVVVLGQLDFIVKDRILSTETSGQQHRQTQATWKSDTSLAKRLEVLDAALARPEADKLGWRDALETAQRDVQAAGEFGDEFYMKSWPSRASAAGGAAHPATGAVLKLSVDDTGNAFPIQYIAMYFRRTDLPADMWVTEGQKLVIPGAQLNRFPYDSLLLPLAPGKYAGVAMEIKYGNCSDCPVARPGGDFENFEVMPGKVTVLPGISLKFQAKAVTMPNGQSGTQASTTIFPPDARYKGSDDPAKLADLAKRMAEGRRASIDAALAHPEAQSLRWRQALESAKDALAL